MKVIPLSKAKARLSEYARLCHTEAIIVTVSGTPAIEMVPLDEEDDLINQLIAHNPKFREMLRRRLHEKSTSAKEALRRL